MIASCLSRQLRKYDLVARYGGDEFAAICFGCGQTQIESLVRRVQSEVRKLTVPDDKGRRGITLSIGTAVTPNGVGGIAPHKLLESADQCLYRAKSEGRNRVVGQA